MTQQIVPRILVAGIGNIFLGDDGFGVEVARRLAERTLPHGVEVVDFGIRGMDLVYALLDNHDAVIFLDVTPRGGSPGTLYLLEPQINNQGEVTLDTHGMNPVKVLNLAYALGAKPARTFVVGCEPALLVDPDSENIAVQLSEPVQAAVNEAVNMVVTLLDELVSHYDGDIAALSATSNRAQEGTKRHSSHSYKSEADEES